MSKTVLFDLDFLTPRIFPFLPLLPFIPHSFSELLFSSSPLHFGIDEKLYAHRTNSAEVKRTSGAVAVALSLFLEGRTVNYFVKWQRKTTECSGKLQTSIEKLLIVAIIVRQKPFTADVKGMKCGGCFLPRYCSKDCQATHWKSVHKKECKSFQNDPCAVITKDLNVRPLSTTMAISCFQRVVATKAAANPTLVGITKYSLPRRLAESILEAINIHQDSPTVIVKGLSVLNLAIKGPSHSDVPVIRRLVSIGVVDTLVSIFKAHPNDVKYPI